MRQATVERTRDDIEKVLFILAGTNSGIYWLIFPHLQYRFQNIAIFYGEVSERVVMRTSAEQ